MGDFKNLNASQEARRLAVLSNAAIAKLPSHEQYVLAPQWRRAVYSVGLNIAEGAGRRGRKEFRRFLDIALASLNEVEAILEIVEGLRYLDGEALSEIRLVRANTARMVFGLIRRMR